MCGLVSVEQIAVDRFDASSFISLLSPCATRTGGHPLIELINRSVLHCNKTFGLIDREIVPLLGSRYSFPIAVSQWS